MKLFGMVVITAALMVFGMLFGCADRSVPEPVDQAVRPAKIFLVQDQRTLKTHEFVGRVEAAQSVDVTFEVSGPLRQLPVREGQSIERGDLVAALDGKDFQLAVDEASAQLQLARQDLKRKRQVLAQRGIARSVVEDAETTYRLQKVRLEKAQQSLADASLRAPFDAYVARRYVDNFVNISAGQNVVKLNDLHRLLVIAHVPENLAATSNAEEIQEMYATFDFAGQQRFALALHENRGEADAVAQTYEISLSMERPTELNILPGMTASVFVTIRDGAMDVPGLYIPTNAVVAGADGEFYVWQFDRESQEVVRVDVQLGAPLAEGVPVIQGLQGGELIVATGASQLRRGMRVRVLGDVLTKI